MTEDIRRTLYRHGGMTGWFQGRAGAHVLVDGQYGSTGKGLLAGLIGETFGEHIGKITTNAGPNSGHTAYFEGEKIVTQQLPVASVVMTKMGKRHKCIMNSGAVINPRIFNHEVAEHGYERSDVYLSTAAARILERHVGNFNNKIASTGKGVGPAMAFRVNRDPEAVCGYAEGAFPGVTMYDPTHLQHSPLHGVRSRHIFVETAQGYSLGIGTGFYPYVTSRDCTVSRAMADANLSPKLFKKSIACYRTFPIRVGDVPGGTSGPCYEDQQELTWEQVGVAPEITTVTKRVRRVFTWSRQQFIDSILANRPDALFINFMNYLREDDRAEFLENVREDYRMILGTNPDFILAGYGPYADDIVLEPTL